MKIPKDTVPDISRERVDKIEAHSRQLRSEAIAQGFKTLFSGTLFKERGIKLKPIKEETFGEFTA